MKTTWTADPAHSEIGFSVKHMMFTKVTGTFDAFTATITTEDDDFRNAEIEATVESNSVDTRNEQRDTHLRSADFFNVEQHPSITFKASTSGLDGGKLTGDLTINGVTKSITLDTEFHGMGKDPWGNLKAGFSFTGKLNRKDFGLVWNAPLEAGGILVSEDVAIRGEIQLAKA